MFFAKCVMKPDVSATFAVYRPTGLQPLAHSFKRCLRTAEHKLGFRHSVLLVFHHEVVLNPRTSRDNNQHHKQRPSHAAFMRGVVKVRNGVVSEMAAWCAISRETGLSANGPVSDNVAQEPIINAVLCCLRFCLQHHVERPLSDPRHIPKTRFPQDFAQLQLARLGSERFSHFLRKRGWHADHS